LILATATKKRIREKNKTLINKDKNKTKGKQKNMARYLLHVYQQPLEGVLTLQIGVRHESKEFSKKRLGTTQLATSRCRYIGHQRRRSGWLLLARRCARWTGCVGSPTRG
jgi:hypothetical protein